MTITLHALIMHLYCILDARSRLVSYRKAENPVDYINRNIESIATETAGMFKVLLISGARQVGKSTILNHLFADYKQIVLDDLTLRTQAINEPGLFIKDNPPPALIDEVQYAPNLFPYIKMVCDKSNENGLYLMTGSQQFRLMKNVSESLAGRVGILELSTFSLREIQRIPFNKHFIPTETYIKSREKHIKPYKDLWEIIHRGGYPALQDKGVSWERFFISYIQTYVERDIKELGMIKDQLKFNQFLTALAARTAQIINYQNMADELEISLNTVKNWVSLLEATGLIFILQPFSNNALTRAIKTPKLYFKDTGLVCYLTKWNTPETAKIGAMAGALFETFVVSEILKSYSNEGLDYRSRIFWYRGKDKLRRKHDGELVQTEMEIDLILEENGIYHPIEIKMTANPKANMAAGFEVLDKIPDAKRGEGAIICLYDKPISLRENVRAIPVNYI